MFAHMYVMFDIGVKRDVRILCQSNVQLIHNARKVYSTRSVQIKVHGV